MPSKATISKLRHEAESLISGLPEIALSTDKSTAHILHGRHAQKKSGAGENFWQFRTYQETDSPQNIDWRQSAKTDHVYIRQHERQSINRAFLWSAHGQSMNFASSTRLRDKQTHAHLLLLSISLLLLRGEEYIGLYGDIKTGKSERTLDKITAQISGRKEDESLPDITQFLLPPHAGFIGIGDFLDPFPEIKQRLEFIAARAGSGLIIQVLDPAEVDLHTLGGRIQFKGLEANEDQLINNVRSISESYAQRINDHIEHIKTFCKDYGWHYILHRTDQPIEETLKSIWMINSEFGGK